MILSYRVPRLWQSCVPEHSSLFTLSYLLEGTVQMKLKTVMINQMMLAVEKWGANLKIY